MEFGTVADLPPHYVQDEGDKYKPRPMAYGGQPGSGNTVIYTSSTPSVTVVTQPVSSNRIPKAGEGREWNHELCGCCDDVGSCCLGLFCTTCQLCCILNSMDELTCCACMSGGTSAVLARMKIRTALGIKGSICGDICCTAFCIQCVSCQMYMELKDQGMLKDSCCYCGCDSSRQCYCH